MPNNFPVVDITHKPKRTQADNLRKGQKVQSITTVTEQDESSKYDIPTYLTLQNAIRYFDAHSDDITNEGKFYSMVHKFLLELLELRSAKRDLANAPKKADDGVNEVSL